MDDITVMPLFASNLIITNIKNDINNIDISKVKFVQASNNNQTSEISESMSVLDDYKKLSITILKIFNSYTHDVLRIDNNFIFSTSWFTKTKPGNFNHYHCHTNSYYSGLFYFDEYCKDSGSLSILNPKSNLNSFHIKPKKININNTNEYIVNPEKNLLILFPSYLWHAILSNTSDSLRYSLAFNIIPTGKYGEGDSTYNTEWFKS